MSKKTIAGVRRWRLSAVMISLLAGLAGASAVTAAEDPADPPYRIVEGKVDRSTFLGWRVFHSACHGCHGVGATGTSVAPNLVERVASLKARDFATKVLTRYRITLSFGDAAGDDLTAVREAFLDQVMRLERGELVMPAWAKDPNVRPHILDLYAYLRARADGALGPHRPEQQED